MPMKLNMRIVSVFWEHMRGGLLKFISRQEYSGKSCGTSKHPCYEGSEYNVTAALSFFGIASNEEMPAKNTFTPHISAQSEENNKIYFEEVLGKFSDVYLLQKTAITDGEDYVKNYALHVFHLSYHPHFATERHGSRSRWRKKPYQSEITSLCL